jgi:hypothetical protein
MSEGTGKDADSHNKVTLSMRIIGYVETHAKEWWSYCGAKHFQVDGELAHT